LFFGSGNDEEQKEEPKKSEKKKQTDKVTVPRVKPKKREVKPDTYNPPDLFAGMSMKKATVPLSQPIKTDPYIPQRERVEKEQNVSQICHPIQMNPQSDMVSSFGFMNQPVSSSTQESLKFASLQKQIQQNNQEILKVEGINTKTEEELQQEASKPLQAPLPHRWGYTAPQRSEFESKSMQAQIPQVHKIQEKQEDSAFTFIASPNPVVREISKDTVEISNQTKVQFGK
jgi:hypothetical protein